MIFVDFEVLMLLYLDQVSTADSKKKNGFFRHEVGKSFRQYKSQVIDSFDI